MGNNLFRKLFLAFAAVTLVVMVCMLLYANWSFKRGFNDYLLAQEQLRLESLAQSLLQHYGEHGDWTDERALHAVWRGGLSLQGGRAAPTKHGERPPPKKPPPKRPDSKREKPQMAGREPMLEHRLALVDASGALLIGSPHLQHESSPPLLRTPLTFEDQPVAELLLLPPKSVDDQLARAFLDRQLSLMLWVAPLATLFALFCAALLVRHFLNPITRLAAGTQRLKVGDYHHRISSLGNDELGGLAEDFNALAATLESDQQLRQRWIADTSHELRTPLAVLRSEIEAIQDGIRKPEPHRIAALHAQVLSLSKLVDDLHQLSLGDAGLIQMQTYALDLSDLLTEMFVSNEARAQSLGLSLQLDLSPAPLIVDGDQSRLLQLFNNLLDNSLRHTHCGGAVRIETERLARTALVRLFDSAPGVTDEALPLLFERLYRPDESRNRNSGGSGLGLAIARQISESHGATLTAQHSALGGLLLEFEIPLLDSAERDPIDV